MPTNAVLPKRQRFVLDQLLDPGTLFDSPSCKVLQNYASRRFDLLLRTMDILVRRMAMRHCPNASSCNAGNFRRRDAFWQGLGQECPS